MAFSRLDSPMLATKMMLNFEVANILLQLRTVVLIHGHETTGLLVVEVRW